MINKVLFKVSQSLLVLSVQTWLSQWEQPESEQLPDNWQITNMQDQIFLHVHNTCSPAVVYVDMTIDRLHLICVVCVCFQLAA